MSEMDDLRSFVEVMRGGGYSRAARQLGLSKSIISRRIARLEAGLGTRLLDRTTRGMSPTDAGSELWVRAGESWLITRRLVTLWQNEAAALWGRFG